MTRRKAGTGSIEILPSGNERLRITVDRKRRDLGTVDAESGGETLDAVRYKLDQGSAKAVGGTTFRAYGEQWLDDLEASGRRSMKTVRVGWRKHVARSDFADFALSSVTRAHVKEFARQLQKKGLGKGTIRNTLGFVKQCFEAAIDEQLVDANPAAFRAKKHRAAQLDPATWTYLLPAEQKQLLECEAIPYEDRLFIEFILGTGMRIGEVVNLALSDLHVDKDPRVVVRIGARDATTTKTGRIRVVPLWGHGLRAARGWVEFLKTSGRKNPHSAAFPLKSGCRRLSNRPFGTGANLWFVYLKAAGFTRRIRIHDLRHTCASSMVAGWWGKVWSLMQVRDYLGHTSIKLTERYTHLAVSDAAEFAQESDRAWSANPTPIPRTTPEALVSEASAVENSTSTRSTDTPVVSGGYATSWASRGIRSDLVEVLSDIARRRAVDPERLRQLADKVRDERRAADPLEQLCARAEEPGPHQVDRFVELAAAVLDQAPDETVGNATQNGGAA